MPYSRNSDNNEESKRDIPSFIEPRPPLISNPFMRPKPVKGTNLLELFEEDSELEEPELLQVYLRLKPCHKNSNLYEIRSERCLVTCLDTTTAGHGRRTQHNVSKMYTFSHIFKPDSTQTELFEHVVKDNLKKLPDGHSFTLLTYGASGSGKTYTLMGTVSSPGLVPRSLEYVFKIIDAAQKPVYKPSETGFEILNNAEQDFEIQWVKRLRQISAPLRDKYRRMSANLSHNFTSNIDLTGITKHYVWVSFIEIYNEGIYDLLVPYDRRASSKLAIREDSSGNIYVKGAMQAFVRSGEEAYDVMVAGKHNLQVAATGVHAQSSRSHCIFTITMLTEIDGEVRTACVRLCDLAGCERAARTQNTGARMQESRAINSSLHVLERCLHTLRRRQNGRARALVPYRESKLTRLLGAGLSGTRGEAVSMVVTLNPEPQYAHETRHVLQLAAVAKDIQVNNTISEYPSSLETTQDSTIIPSTEVMMLRTDNERLKFELLQAESRKKDLENRLDELQPFGMAQIDNMTELLKEAKESTQKYYEERMQILQLEMEEKAKEYKGRINQLVRDNTILEEKLTAEKLARARAEEEVQHLRACVDERDEIVLVDGNDPVTSSIESDTSDNEIDPLNETLEPVFKKDDINRSILVMLNSPLVKIKDTDNRESKKENDTVSDVSEDMLNYKDDDDSCVNNIVTDPNENNSIDSNIPKYNNHDKYSIFETEIKSDLIDTTNKEEPNVTSNQSVSLTKTASSLSRSTYCVIKENSLYESSRDAYRDSDISNDASSYRTECEDKDDFKIPEEPTTFVNSIINSLKKPSVNNNSLLQFEHLELASKKINDTKEAINVEFDNIKMLKNKQNFFDDNENVLNNINPSDKNSFFDNVDVNIKDAKYKRINVCYDSYRSPSIVKDECTSDFEPARIKKLLGESITNTIEPISTVKRSNFSMRHDSVDVFESRDSSIDNKLEDDLPNIEEIRKSMAKVRVSNIEANDQLLTKCKLSIPSYEEKNITKVENKDITLKESIEKLRSLRRDSICDKKILHNEINLQYSVPKLDNLCLNQVSTVTMTEEKKKCYQVNENTCENEKIATKEGLEPSNICINIFHENRNTRADEVQKNLSNFENDNATTLLRINKKEPNYKPLRYEGKPSEIKECITANNQSSIENTQSLITNNKVDNTLEEFEKIYQDITAPRCTEFDLLVSQVETEMGDSKKSADLGGGEVAEGKYNLRNKSKTVKKSRTKYLEGEILMESSSKLESNAKPSKRNLRLRRRKLDDDLTVNTSDEKLKDIANLQTEFSDVIMGIPAPQKTIQDIPSPGQKEDENLPPMMGIQSCPAKSVTRSRRKLFTPRVEPLEDDSGDNADGEVRVRVPRPSYQRPRARRKL